jgi:hypothetical protein
MTVDVSVLGADGCRRWDDLVRRSLRATVFHRSAILRALAGGAGVTLHPLVGAEDGTPVGLFPVFELDKGPFSAAFSPLPGAVGDVPRARRALRRGRLLPRRGTPSPGVRRGVLPVRGARHRSRVHSHHHLFRNDDIRPFQWQGYQAEPRYTYVVELTDEEELVGRFSSDARRNVRDSYEDHVIEAGGREAIDRILDQVRRRYDEQGEPKSLPYAFARHLHADVDEDVLYPYVYRTDEEFVGGILALACDDTVYRWLGGVKPAVEVDAPVNDLVDWRIMTDAMAAGYGYYDLVGAGNDRINRYKTKFNPTLRTFYRISSDSRLTDVAVATYEQFLEYKGSVAGQGPF